MKTDKQKQGKRNIGIGRRFEVKVYKDLEAKGWICARWTKNVEILKHDPFPKTIGKLIPSRQGKFRKVSTGLPDFIAFKFDSYDNLNLEHNLYHIIGVECKSNGYLTKEEKVKCKWLLDNNVFSKILIAKKGKKRGEIEYKKFGNGN